MGRYRLVGAGMKPEECFEQMRAHADAGGTLSPYQREALKAWEQGDRHTANELLAYHDLQQSGGIVGAP